MSKDCLTLYSYIRTNNTNNTSRFVSILGENVIEKLPDKICSSKVLYDMLRDDLNTYFKQCIFRDTFMEYFKWKVMYNGERLF